MGLRPYDNGSRYRQTYYRTANLLAFPNEVTWSCWMRPLAGVSGGDEWIFGTSRFNFARQTGSNTVYSHVSEGGSHSFLNYGAISGTGLWYHLLGRWDRPTNFDHSFFVNGSKVATGTTLINNGGAGGVVFAYDSQIEIAHAAIWAGAMSDGEVAAYWRMDPRKVLPHRLRGYWPLVADPAREWLPTTGVDVPIDWGTSGLKPLETTDGPPVPALVHQERAVSPSLHPPLVLPDSATSPYMLLQAWQ